MESIPYDELQIGDMLGKGAFGAVFRGKWKDREVAIKQIFTTADYDVDFYFSREVEILGSISHPNIVGLYGVSKSTDGLFMITELVQGMNLREHLKGNPNWTERIKIALQVAMSLSYLHQHKIIHRDVKTENVLIDGNTRNAKLCDFGFSRSNDDASKKKTFCGSEWFEAPEIMFCMDYDERIDIFSYGVVLCELISREQPSMSIFKREIPGFGISSSEILTRANEGCPPGFTQVVINAVEADPEKRPTLESIIAKLKELYERVSGSPYNENEEELQLAEAKLQKFNLEQEKKPNVYEFPEDDRFIPAEVPTNSSRRHTLPPKLGIQIKIPGIQEPPPLAAITKPSSPNSPIPLSPKSTSASFFSSASTSPSNLPFSSSLLTIARLQQQAADAPPESPIKGIIPQKDQIVWRNFLVEFRSSVKVRDIQKTGAMKKIKTFRNCFVGCEGIDWLVKEKKMDRAEGLEICNILVKLSVVRAATPTGTISGPTTPYKDTKSDLYRFSDDGIFFRREKAPNFLKRLSVN